jgi:hypothetical protein
MRQLLFISLFLLLKCISINAQNQRISVDLLSPGVALSNLNSNDNINWYSLTYESKREEEKTWGIRASFAEYREVQYYDYNSKQGREIDLIQQSKIAVFRRKYISSQYFGELFTGGYVSLSYLTHGDYSIPFNEERSNNLNSGFHVGGGILYGTHFRLSEHFLLELSGGIGGGVALNPELYLKDTLSGVENLFILFSPSFFDINLCYEF